MYSKRDHQHCHRNWAGFVRSVEVAGNHRSGLKPLSVVTPSIPQWSLEPARSGSRRGCTHLSRSDTRTHQRQCPKAAADVNISDFGLSRAKSKRPHDGLTEQPLSFSAAFATGGHHQPAMGACQYRVEGSPSRRFSYQAIGTTTPQSTNQTIPSTTSLAGPLTPAGRESSQTVHPYPMAARRVLTPKSPKAFSLSRAAIRAVEAQHLVSPVEPSQTLLQPSLGRSLPSAPHHEPLPSGSLKREHSGRAVLSGFSFPSPLPTNRPLGISRVSGEGGWGAGRPEGRSVQKVRSPVSRCLRIRLRCSG